MEVELTKEWCINMANIEARAAELHEGCRMPMEQAREIAASEASPDWYARGQDWGLADALTNCQNGDWTLDDIARAFSAGAHAALHTTEKKPRDQMEIEELWDQAHEQWNQAKGDHAAVQEMFARLIERAHGIGV